MATTTGSSGDDLINGTSTNDNLNGGAGDDTLLGGAGNDNLSGGSGNDTLNGDAGSDTLNGGSGSDLLIYKLAENANGTDLYTGGSGIDTVELQLTTLEWESATVKQQLNYYFGHLETVRRSGQGEVSNGQASDFTFQFGTSTLTVSMMENLQVKVDGVLLSNLDAPYIDSGDTTDHGSLVEDGILTASGTLAFFNLDASDTHTFQIVDEPSSAFGTLALAPSDSTGDGIGQVNWTHVLNNDKAQSLGEGQVATETYTVRIADSDNTANYVDRTVTISITGDNDAPLILGGNFNADGSLDTSFGAPTLEANGRLAFKEVDLSDVHRVSVAGNAGNLLGGTLVAEITDAATGVGAGTVAWSYSVVNGATQYLGEGQEAKESFTVTLDDGHGGTVNQLVTITITGTGAPVVAGSTMNVIREHLINSTHDGFTSDTVGTIFASDPDGDPLTYSILSDSSGGGFTIDATTGQVTVRDVSLLDYEGSGLTTDGDGKFYSLQVQISDGSHATTHSTKVYLTNVTSTTVSEQDNYVDGGIGRDGFTTQEGNDVAFGDGERDTLIGGAGNDYLFGGKNGDQLYGNDGDDVLYGGGLLIRGDTPDRLEGGSGSDTFVFGGDLGIFTTVIRDFEPGIDKILLVSDALGPFAALADSGTLAANQFDLYGSAGIDADTRIIYDPSIGGLYYDADGSGSGSAMNLFAGLTNRPTALSETDFILGPPPGP